MCVGRVKNAPACKPTHEADFPKMSKILTNFPLDKQLNRCYNKNVLKREEQQSDRPHRGQKESDTMTKLTYVNALEVALTYLPDEIDDAVRDKLTALRDQLVLKRHAAKTGERKPTKAQKENEQVKVTIKSHMGLEPKQCKDIAAECGLSLQKVSALLKQMVAAGDVVKTEGKGDKGGKVSLFRLA